MSATPDSNLANPEQLIADLQRQRDECKAERDECQAERDEALEQQTATAEVLQVIDIPAWTAASSLAIPAAIPAQNRRC